MSSTAIDLAAIAVPVVLAQVGLSADAWRRARQAEETTEDVEDKIDVLLASLGLDPDDPPEYAVEDVAERRADGGDPRDG